jgi:hypothetical protein
MSYNQTAIEVAEYAAVPLYGMARSRACVNSPPARLPGALVFNTDPVVDQTQNDRRI